ncbi:MAG: ferritin-like domain-containing protein [Nitrospirota bacterium]
MNAWDVLTAEGTPESGMAYFEGTEKTEELIGLAWILEDGSGEFYSSLSDVFGDTEAKDLFSKLTDAEENHKTPLNNLSLWTSGKHPGKEFPRDVISVQDAGDVMEEGMRVSEGIEWVNQNGFRDALDLSVSLEANSYDLYIKMSQSMKDEHSRNVFETLVKEERYHLRKLAELLEKKI